ncbi:MAG: hypothetical protein WCR42_09790 [bacterium]
MSIEKSKLQIAGFILSFHSKFIIQNSKLVEDVSAKAVCFVSNSFHDIDVVAIQ